VTAGVVVLDKPRGITSFRAVERVRRIFREKKCGHAGTLDPLATGVLPICLGRATKIAGYLAEQEKAYDVLYRFGVETDTGDCTGRETAADPGRFAVEDAVRASVEGLVGTWDQVPPSYSAVKVAGTRAYLLARQGRPAVLAPRSVTVHEARLLGWSPEGFRLFIRCSKGFYVRALSRDMGRALGVPMTVESLSRVGCGPFRLEEAVSLEALAEAAAQGEARRFLFPIERALAGFPQWRIPAAAAAAVRRGRAPDPWLAGREIPPGRGAALLTTEDGGPVALVGRAPGGGWRILRGI
jgi:tRNA pseudouridine55 synthase